MNQKESDPNNYNLTSSEVFSEGKGLPVGIYPFKAASSYGASSS